MSQVVRLPMRLVLALVLVAAAAVSRGAAERRSIAHEDVWLMQRVGDPVLSRDGRWVVYPVTQPAYRPQDQRTDLWMEPTDGSRAPRRLTSDRRAESGATWSPTARRIAFSVRRKEAEPEQIYVRSVDSRRSARPITALSTGARAPRWRPDGNAILFTSSVYPGALTDADNLKMARARRAREHNARVYDHAPIRHWDHWLDERRPSLFVQLLDPGSQAPHGAPRNLLAESTLLGRPGFGGRLEIQGELLDPVWTPDGRAVLFVATANRDQWAYAETTHSLWLVSADGGEPQQIVPDGASYELPAFSPDGRALYALREANGDKVYNAKRLVRWDWPGLGAPQVLTAAFDRAVSEFSVSPDGERVYFLAEDAGSERLYEVPAAGGTVREVGALTAGCYTGLAVGGDADSGTTIVSNWESATRPAEVGRVDVASGRWTAITALNSERVARIDWQPLQEFWFTASTGRRIHNYLALPPGFDPARKYPLFVLIHGGPHTMWRDQFFVRWNYHLLAAPGYVVLLTNYSGSTGFGEAHAQAIQGDPLQGPGREINDAADAAARQFPFIDATRQAAGGASYGGHLTNWLAVTTDRYRALVTHAGLFDLKTQWSTSDIVYSRERNMGGPVWAGGEGWREQSPLYRADRLKTPMLLTIGERDYRVPINNTFELWTALQRQKVPSRLVVFPDENHWIANGNNSRFFYEEVRAWLGRYLAGDEAPRGVASR